MGTTLNGTTPQNTYPSLIKVGDNGSLSGTAKVLSDGEGNDSVLALSTTAVGIGTNAPFSLLTVAGQSSFLSVQSAGIGSDFFYSDINPNITAGANNQIISLLRLRDRGRGNTGGFTGTQRLSLLMENGGGGQFPFQLFSDSGALRIGFTSVATPTAKLEIRGSGTTSATTTLLVQNSANSPLLSVLDDGNAIVNNLLSVGGAVNTTGFGQKIRIIGQGDSALGIYRNQESTSAAKLEFMKSRGTYDVPLIVNSNDILGNIGFFGYNGTSYINAAFIQSVALSTSTGVEGDLRFIVFNNTGGNVNTMRATKDGVGIGNALDYLPSARLQIRGSGTTSATTALLVQNSAGTQAFKVEDGGSVKIGLTSGINWTFGSNTLSSSQFAYISSSNGSIISTGALNGGVFGNNNGGKVADSGIATAQVASAVLEVSSTTRGFLPPRMTTEEKNAIATPAAGLVVYDTTLNKLCVYTTAWEIIASA
jgi:hypothetical protein